MRQGQEHRKDDAQTNRRKEEQRQRTKGKVKMKSKKNNERQRRRSGWLFGWSEEETGKRQRARGIEVVMLNER